VGCVLPSRPSPCTWLSVSAPALLYLLCPYSRPTLRVLCLIRLPDFPDRMKHNPTTSAVPSLQGFVSLAFQSSSCASNQGLDGSPKFLSASLCTCHSLLTPETLHILTKTDASVLPSVYVKTLGDLNLPFEAVPALRRYELPTACTILCRLHG